MLAAGQGPMSKSSPKPGRKIIGEWPNNAANNINQKNPTSGMAMKRFAALLTLTLFLAHGCTTLPPPKTNMAYLEIVQEKQSCLDGGCFTEYLFASSGIALKKQYNLPNYRGEPTMELRRMKNASATLLFDKARKFLEDDKNSSGSADSPNNIFFADNSKLYALSFPGNPPGQFLEFFNEAQAEFGAADPDVDFYVHQYYQPVGGDTVDFHIFSDGILIRSAFASGSNTLKSSGIIQLPEGDISVLRDMADNATGPQYAKSPGCGVDTGLEYGYVEIKQNGEYLGAYTCGNGNDGIGAIFTFVKNKYG